MSRRTSTMFALILIVGFAAVTLAIIVTNATDGDKSVTNSNPNLQRLIELAEQSTTPHHWCGTLQEELRYAAAYFNQRTSNTIYQQQLWQARTDSLLILGAIWNCPIQDFYGFTEE